MIICVIQSESDQAATDLAFPFALEIRDSGVWFCEEDEKTPTHFYNSRSRLQSWMTK